MFERFTRRARAAVVAAHCEAVAFDHQWIGTEHLLLGLFDDADGRAARVLRERFGVERDWVRGEVERVVGRGEPGIDADALATLGIDLDAVRERVEKTFGAGALHGRPGRRGRFGGDRRPFTPRAKKALELSLREAVAMGDRFVGAEHVLLGLVREGEGVAARILNERGVDRAAVHAALRRDAAA
jgi:ATP-dependent Clp protease ATP-binding subunit ClpA